MSSEVALTSSSFYGLSVKAPFGSPCFSSNEYELVFCQTRLLEPTRAGSGISLPKGC
jgi:hypothetical protein